MRYLHDEARDNAYAEWAEALEDNLAPLLKAALPEGANQEFVITLHAGFNYGSPEVGTTAIHFVVHIWDRVLEVATSGFYIPGNKFQGVIIMAFDEKTGGAEEYSSSMFTFNDELVSDEGFLSANALIFVADFLRDAYAATH